MKLWWIALLVLGVAGVYLYLNPHVGVEWREGTPLEGTTTTVVYKWRDADGKWQITDEPPANGVDYEVLDYRHDTNVLPKDD